MSTRRAVVAIVWTVVAVAASARPLGAQTTFIGDPPFGVPLVRLGRVALAPALVATGSRDTNVLRGGNETIDGFESVTVPQLDGFYSAGRFGVHASGAIEFARYPGRDKENFINDQEGFDLGWRQARVEPFFGFYHRNTYARPELEIGNRSDRRLLDTHGGAQIHLSSRMSVRLEGKRGQTNYQADAVYRNTSLREKLNNTHQLLTIAGQYQLTPVTALQVSGERSRDTFEITASRNAKSHAVTGGVLLGSPTFLSGAASIGVRWFEPERPDLKPFTGLVGNGAVSYGRSAVRITVTGYRDVAYSYDSALAYFVVRSINAVLAGRAARWDYGGWSEQSQLDYGAAGTAAGAGRLDKRIQYGGALGFRVGRVTRVGVNVSQDRSVGGQEWEAWRVSTFLTYGSGDFIRLDRPTPR